MKENRLLFGRWTSPNNGWTLSTTLKNWTQTSICLVSNTRVVNRQTKNPIYRSWPISECKTWWSEQALRSRRHSLSIWTTFSQRTITWWGCLSTRSVWMIKKWLKFVDSNSMSIMSSLELRMQSLLMPTVVEIRDWSSTPWKVSFIWWKQTSGNQQWTS